MPVSVPGTAVISPTAPKEADALLDRLSEHKHTWAALKIPERIDLLRRCVAGVLSVAAAWAEAACLAKGIDPQSELAGEEWLIGPMATIDNLQQLIQALEAGGQPQPVQLSSRSDGQKVAQVFPDNLMDRLLWLGFTGDVWIEPGQPATQGKIYRESHSEGQVALVLGAGNVSSIAPMDALYKLFAENQVVLLKMNPVNQYVGPLLEQAFQSLCAAGFFAIVYGGAEMGAYLCQHPQVDTIHITGSHHTHDAIVWGSTAEERAQRKQANQPKLTKPITSELGCVTPVLIVPGRWSRSDLDYQARQVASAVVHNASFNCAAAKVVVTAKGWEQRQEFLDLLHQQLEKIAPRQAYYPGAHQRYQQFLDRYPQAIALGDRTEEKVPWTILPEVPPVAGEYALTTEAFCGVLAEVTLDVSNAREFLTQAVAFANQGVWGNLSCTLLIDPATQKHCAAEFDAAIGNLHFGSIAINVWSGVAYLIVGTTWGAFPGNPLTNITSGRGVVHNAYLFDHPQKSVVRAPFRIRPTPVWFANHRNLRQVAQQITELKANPSWGKFLQVLLAAIQG